MIPGPEIGEATRTAVGVLESGGYVYALGGAIAMGLLGHLRATKDVDILAVIPQVRSQEFVDAMDAAGFRARDAHDRAIPLDVPTMIQARRDLGLCRVWWKEVKVEIFAPKVPLQDSILKRRVRVDLGGYPVWMTTAEDLILLKMIFHRDKDIVDVRRLLVANSDLLDRAYLEEWIGRTLSNAVGDELREMLLHIPLPGDRPRA